MKDLLKWHYRVLEPIMAIVWLGSWAFFPSRTLTTLDAIGICVVISSSLRDKKT